MVKSRKTSVLNLVPETVSGLAQIHIHLPEDPEACRVSIEEIFKMLEKLRATAKGTVRRDGIGHVSGA